MLEGKNKKEQVELKRNVCTSLNIREHTLREAIRRYRRRMSNKDSVLSIDTNNYNIKYRDFHANNNLPNFDLN